MAEKQKTHNHIGWVIKTKSSGWDKPLYMKYKGETPKTYEYIILPDLVGAIIFKTKFETDLFIKGFKTRNHDLEAVQILQAIAKGENRSDEN